MSEKNTTAQRLVTKREFAQAARLRALAYQIAPAVPLLLEIARATRQAELDVESFVLYSRLSRDFGTETSQDEVEDEVKALRIKLDETEDDVRTAQSVRHHLDLAKRFYQSGRFAAAAPEYALAYALRPLPRVLFNTAQAYRRASLPEQAILLYMRFVTDDPESPYRNEAMGYIQELRRVVFQPPLQRRPWFWVAVSGGAALVGAALASAAVAAQPKAPTTDGGTQVVRFAITRVSVP